jgi:MYXO-CTERM domain-containing protein
VNFDNTPGVSVSGPNADIGWEFSITSPISVIQLGFWDEGGNGLGEQHPIAIWSSSGSGDLASALVGATIPAGTGSTLAPGSLFRMVDVTHTILPAGDYVIGARLPEEQVDPFKDGSVNNITNLVLGPGINLIEKRFGGGPVIPFQRPDGTDRGVGIFGPNFAYLAVPEPSSLALAIGLASLAGLGVWRRQRSP